ncbi:14985_t:CDS:1, partial [Funneliformis caledonium]
DDEDFIMKFDNDSYLQALSSLNKEQDDFILQNDAEEEDTGSVPKK